MSDTRPIRRLPGWRAVAVVLAGLGLAAPAAHATQCVAARKGCAAAARYAGRACERGCTRRIDAVAVAACRASCRQERQVRAEACRTVAQPCDVACQQSAPGCEVGLRTCRASAQRTDRACRRACDGGDVRCLVACDRQRAAAEGGCGFVVVGAVQGPAELPALPAGRPADLAVLLDQDEQAVVADADVRAETLRTRPLRLWVGTPGTRVAVTQTRHAFAFGFPIDFREFRTAPDDLAFYAAIARDHTNLMVAETSLKWRTVEPSPGQYAFGLADDELAWGASLGFPVKGHTLLWGNAPPFSTGSGIPEWLRERFPDPALSPAERSELRELVRRRVNDVVGRYRGRIDIWDVTNETLNPFTPWFMDRLGPTIVDEIFRWAHDADPGAQLVFNEWITEVFTGLPGPSAVDVRDRVSALLAAGVPIHAVGQQGHFVPGVVYAGIPGDLSQRTRIDAYAVALDTLAQTGLPVHITEVNFVAPDEPEARAAQAEALMRLWWGHPAVEQIVFWGLWNKVTARNELQIGLWDDTGALSRHGEAVISLLNDRWRTRAVATADAQGFVELRATLGDYVATWDDGSGPVHARFLVERGPGAATVVVAGQPD